LIESRTYGIGGGIADTPGTFFERILIAAGVNKLLAETAFIIPDRAAKDARPLDVSAACRERASIEFEHKPPIDRVVFVQERHWSASCKAGRARKGGERREGKEYNSRADPDAAYHSVLRRRGIISSCI
jgi:hypothetical protein